MYEPGDVAATIGLVQNMIHYEEISSSTILSLTKIHMNVILYIIDHSNLISLASNQFPKN